MYRLFGDTLSGNCYKVQLLLHYLGEDYEWVPIDILRGETQSESFLQRNPNGKIPVLELEDGEYLWESNAILNFLADGTDYLPPDAIGRARVLQWQFFEQYSHEPYIAVARFIETYLGLPEDRTAEYEAKRAGGYRALEVMEKHLDAATFFVGGRLSVADISLYAYTHVAHEGGFSLDRFPAVRAWLARVSAHPGHVLMAASGEGAP